MKCYSLAQDLFFCGFRVTSAWPVTRHYCKSSPFRASQQPELTLLGLLTTDQNSRSHQWQSSWSLETENKLHAIEPTVNITKSYRPPSRDEIIIHRHTFLTHGHLLKRDSPPQCSACQTQLTVEHVLLHCSTWNAIRANHFTVTNLLDLFSKVTPRYIVDFIKEIGFYRRI